MDIFNEKNIAPMLMIEGKAFNNNNYIFELKLDGIRCIAFLDVNQTVLRNKRNKDVTFLYPELNLIHKNIKKKCILDGELVLLKNGKPDFYELQKRSLMQNGFKIKIASKSFPVEFVCFDILYYNDKELIDVPLLQRKNILQKNVKEGFGLSVSRYIEEYGKEFFNLAKKEKLEGIVAKKKDSLYFLGKRTKEWIKIKVMSDEDLIICGYILNDNNDIKDFILGYFNINKELISRGSVALGISSYDKNLILNFAKKNTVTTPWFDKPKSAVWLKLKYVGACHYMHLTKERHMRQPVFKGIKDDKTIYDCIYKK